MNQSEVLAEFEKQKPYVLECLETRFLKEIPDGDFGKVDVEIQITTDGPDDSEAVGYLVEATVKGCPDKFSSSPFAKVESFHPVHVQLACRVAAVQLVESFVDHAMDVLEE